VPGETELHDRQDPNENTRIPGVKNVPVADIVLRPEWQVRKELHLPTIFRYQTALAYSGMPPINLALINGALVLVDGWHRLAAATRLKRTEIEAKIEEMTEDEAHWKATLANTTHGLPLKLNERRKVFQVYVNAGRNKEGPRRYKSYRRIAEDLNGIVGKTTLQRWMEQDFPDVAARMGNDRPSTSELPETKEEGSMSYQEAGAHLEQIIARARGMDANERRALAERLTSAAATVMGVEPYKPPPPDKEDAVLEL
jgi:hypothetical protein